MGGIGCQATEEVRSKHAEVNCEIIPTSKSVTDKQANKMFGFVCNRGFLITAIKTIAFKKIVKGKESELTIMTVKRNP